MKHFLRQFITLVVLLSPFTLFSQEKVFTTEAPTISAGAEYSMYLEKMINAGRGKELEYKGTLPSLNKTQGIAAITTIEGINFDEDGANNSGFLIIPPDPNGAAGPNHLVSVTNRSIEWFTKAGVNEVSKRLGKNSTTAVGSFFESLAPLTGTFDPKVIYDQYNSRFIVVSLEQTGSPPPTSRILVAVSQTSNPNDGWWFTSINSLINISGDSWADYPGLAVGSNEIYITNNMFRFSDNGYAGGRLWIIDKTAFYSGGAASVNVYDHITLGLGYNSTYQPAHMFGTPPAGVGTFLVLYSGLTDGLNEKVNVIRVDNPLGAISFTGQDVALGNIDNTASGSYLDAPQLGTLTLIETNDRRSLNAVWRNNSLWMTACVVPQAGTDAGQVTAHWFKVNTTTLASLAISDQGDIGGEDIGTGCYTFFPSIAVNSLGDAIIGFSASAPTIYPGAYYAGRYSATTAGTVLPSQVLKTGQDFYIRKFGSTRNRWGDYSGSSVDPSDDLTFYLFNEYALTRGTIFPSLPLEDGRWGTTFGVVPTSALPVELSSFSASTTGSAIKLSWRTETESKNYGFEIERLTGSKESSINGPNGTSFEKIGFTEGYGNSSSPKEYSYIDKSINSGKYSYRLKQIDTDGSFSYSKVIETDLTAPNKYELSQNYPNPFNPSTTINFNLPEAGKVKLSLYNLLGEELKTIVNESKEAGIHTINFNAEELQSGMYIYKIEAGSFIQTRKMMLLK